MSLLAQCGYGRAQKIEHGLDDGVIHGVIMSPRDESRERLERDIPKWTESYPEAIILFDPQFYAATLNEPRDGHLGEYDYYNNNSGLGRTHFSPSRIRRYVKECLNYQFNTFGETLGYLISPSILFDGFRDSWSQIALNMAVESVDYHSSLVDAPPLLVSIVVSENAFQSLDEVEEFLDALTEIDVAGFYLIVRRNAVSQENAMEAPRFGKFMYFCHVLAHINEYRIMVGYSDWHDFLLESVGVDYTACGWHQTLRQFNMKRFQPSSGGRRANRRYSSVPLLSNPLINPELQDINLEGILSHVLSGSNYDSRLIENSMVVDTNWSDEIACLAHWHSLNSLSEQIASQGSLENRIQEALRVIQSAQGLYSRLDQVGISFGPATGPRHLPEWQDGVQEFRNILRT
jgi:hypothetical protein